jgi:hypothetical protein
MKRSEFESFRREIFEGGNYSEKHLLIIEHIENSVLYEAKQLAFFGRLFSWFRRNFSAKSIKIRELVNEYAEYLRKEYNAKYVAGEKNLNDFFRNVEISDDMKERIFLVAGKNGEYRDLAEELILEAQIKVKKEFAEKIEGKDGKTVAQLKADLENAKKKVKTSEENLSKDDIEKFTTATKVASATLGKTIGAEMGKDLASSLAIFLNNLKTKGENIEISSEAITNASEPYVNALKAIDPDDRKNALEHFRTLLTDKGSFVYKENPEKKSLVESYKKYRGTLQSKAKTYPNVFEEGGDLLERMLFSLESEKGMELLDKLGLIEDTAKRSEYLAKISEMLDNTENDPEARDKKTEEWIKFLENDSKPEDTDQKPEAKPEEKVVPEEEKDDSFMHDVFVEIPRISDRAVKDMIDTFSSGKVNSTGKIVFDSTHKYSESANLVKRPAFGITEEFLTHAKKIKETPDLYSNAKIALVENVKHVLEAIRKERGESVLKGIAQTEESLRSLVLKVFLISGLDTEESKDLEKFKKLIETA